MPRIPDWLRHAFAVEPAGPAEPSPQQAEVIDRVCRAVVARRLTTPALFALETARPLNFVTAQAAVFFEPVVASVVNAEGYREFVTFLERRGSVDYIAGRIEAIEAEAVAREERKETRRADDATTK